MVIPLLELIKRLFIIDGIAEDTDTSIVEEKVSEIMHRGVARCVPNIQLHLVLVDLDQLGVVLDHLCLLKDFAPLLFTFHERADN